MALGGVRYDPCPLQIENGYWDGFFHGKTEWWPSGSVGAVVYRGKYLKDEDCDWMFSWSNPWRRIDQDNCVYTEIHGADDYWHDHWGYINDKFSDEKAKEYKAIWNGCPSLVKTETGTTVVVEAILTLKLD